MIRFQAWLLRNDSKIFEGEGIERDTKSTFKSGDAMAEIAKEVNADMVKRPDKKSLTVEKGLGQQVIN